MQGGRVDPRWLGALGVALALVAARAGAAPETPEAAGPAPVVAPDSPRASVSRFLELTRAGKLADAAGYLDVAPERAAEAPELARKLKAVLARKTLIDLGRVSPASRGDEGDGLPPGVDQLATLTDPDGLTEPVLLVRDPAHRRWRFSRDTVERLDEWYERLGTRWVLEHLPRPLLESGPRDLAWWQWIALAIIVAVGWVLGVVLGWLARRGLGKLTARTPAKWDDTLLERLKSHLAVAFALGVIYLLLPLLELHAGAQAFVNRVLSTAFFILFFSALFRAIQVISGVIVASPWAKSHPASRSLVPLGARTANVVLVAVAVIAVLSEFGYPVTSLIAGLGIGGLAIALAGQKTMEHLFGAFAIGLDQPFRQGDWISLDGVQGSVEQIGLRSTRIRTMDRTLISIPNGKVAEMRVESYAARERIRFACELGLEYRTTAAQMHAVLAGLERVLREHPKSWKESLWVRFKALGDSALVLEVNAWFETTDWSEFMLIRQEVLLKFMEVVEKAGTGFAFPTRTVHLVREP